MLAKPRPALAAGHPELAAIAERGRAAILALPSRSRLGRTSSRSSPRGRCEPARRRPRRGSRRRGAWLAAAAAGASAAAELAAARRARAVARDRRRARAAGAARGRSGTPGAALYPAIVERLGGGGLADATGPPSTGWRPRWSGSRSARRRSTPRSCWRWSTPGVVDLALSQGARSATAAGTTFVVSERAERAVDVVVDAVLPAPGVLPGASPLLDGLIADGHARVLPGRRGLDVDAAGSCRSAATGRPRPGWRRSGGPTEDCGDRQRHAQPHAAPAAPTAGRARVVERRRRTRGR